MMHEKLMKVLSAASVREYRENASNCPISHFNSKNKHSLVAIAMTMQVLTILTSITLNYPNLYLFQNKAGHVINREDEIAYW